MKNDTIKRTAITAAALALAIVCILPCLLMFNVGEDLRLNLIGAAWFCLLIYFPRIARRLRAFINRNTPQI